LTVAVVAIAGLLSAAPASAGAAPQAPTAVLTYTGCLNNANTIVQVAVGDIPANPPCRSGAIEVHFSGGDLTSITAETGLTGGGANGDVSIALTPTFRLPQTCTPNQGTAWNGTGWACAAFTSEAAFNSLVALLDSPGTINQGSNPVHWTKLKGVPAGFADGTDDFGPSYSAGFGLNLSGTTFSVDSAQVQRRVFETCAAGSAIRAVQEDGTVTCETVSSGGGARWSLTGNAGTDDTNYLGTSDDRPLNLKVNGQRALRLEPRSESPNVIGGQGGNSTAPTVVGATIGGGGGSSAPNSVFGDFGTVGGGEGNEATGPGAFVGGGFMNRADGQRAVVPGGSFNEAIGDWSFAAGASAHADHFGSFVWNGGGADTHSTGTQQFVVRAAGGLHLLDGQLFCEGCVNVNDLAPEASQPLGPYCALVREHPQSYDDAPCRTLRKTLDSTGGETSITMGTDGSPVVSSRGPAGSLDVVHCTDPRCSGHDAPRTLDSFGGYTSIAIGTDGNPVVSYRGPGVGWLRVAHCTDVECTGHDAPTTLDSYGINTSIAIGTDGNPVISYYGGDANEFKLVHCTNPACSTYDVPRTLAAYGVDTSIAIGADGNAVVGYKGVNGPQVVHCMNPACSAHSTSSPFDSFDSSGTSIAIGTDGNPVVSYRGPGGTVKVAHCTDATCSAHDVPSTLDSSNGFRTSIAIGPDGNPVVSYEGPGDALKLAHCADVACSAHEVPSTLDSLGRWPSIAISTDRNPVVSYQGPGTALKFARPSISN
jgi:hypothetical protein